MNEAGDVVEGVDPATGFRIGGRKKEVRPQRLDWQEYRFQRCELF